MYYFALFSIMNDTLELQYRREVQIKSVCTVERAFAIEAL